jgi:hypothetical protein
MPTKAKIDREVAAFKKQFFKAAHMRLLAEGPRLITMSAAIDAALNRLKEADKACHAPHGPSEGKGSRAALKAVQDAYKKKHQAVEALCSLLNPGLCDDRDDGWDDEPQIT